MTLRGPGCGGPAGTDRTRYIAGMVEQDLDTGATSGYRSLYGFAGTAVAVVDHTADTVVYPVGDHLGSIVAAYNDTTNSVATMHYDPWGAERGGSGALPPTTATPAKPPTRHLRPQEAPACSSTTPATTTPHSEPSPKPTPSSPTPPHRHRSTGTPTSPTTR